METAELIGVLRGEGRLLGDTAERAGLDAAVPTCPGWTVRDLLRHTTMVHRWAARFVAEARTAYVEEDETELDGPELLRCYRDGHEALLSALETAPPDVDCWFFLPAPSPLAFWIRRQAHETTIHRVDAEAALGAGSSPIRPEVAADGVGELLTGFHRRKRSRVRTAAPRTLRVRATDTGDSWRLRLSQEPPQAIEDGAADCELSGPAEQLYLTLWNRRPLDALRLEGDAGLAALWRDTSAVI